MKYLLPILIFLLSPLAGTAQTGGDFQVPPEPEFSIDKFIQKVSARFNNPDSPVSGYQFAISKNGNLYYQESRGFAIHPNDPGNAVLYTNETRQNISSVSKFLCTIVLANVLEEYGIAWDDSVSTYLPASWVSDMAPEHNDPDSPCYITFEKLVRHETCLDFGAEDGSGGYPTNVEWPLYLSSDSINTNMMETNDAFDFNDYRNANFSLARILAVNIWAEENGLIDLDDPTPLSEEESADEYLSLLDFYIYSPLGIDAPATLDDLRAFHDSITNTPWAYQFPFDPDFQDSNNNLGWFASVIPLTNSMGGSSMVLTALELLEILAYFVHDDTGTIISVDQREKILTDALGLAASEEANGLTSEGWVYQKSGTRGPDSLNRATRSAIYIFPNGYELSILTNCYFGQFNAITNYDYPDSWVAECGTFTHVTADGSISANRSRIDNQTLNNSPDKLIFITHDFTLSAQISLPPAAVYYDDGHWWVYNQGGATMSSGKRYNILAFDADYPRAFKHSHVPNVEGSPPHVSVIDHPYLNGNPDAKVMVTQDFGGPAGVANNHSVGVWYNGTKWTIFNQDFSPMVAGAKFNVLFDHVHIEQLNITNPIGQFFEVPETTLSPQVRSQMLFTTNSLSPDGQFNDSEVGTWYLNDQWNIYNENGNFFLPGAKVNLLKMEDCECCGENPGESSNLSINWCPGSEDPKCLLNFPTDTISCAEDVVVYEPILFDQCEVLETPEPSIVSYAYIPGSLELPKIRVQYSLSYYGANVTRSYTFYILDTIPPDLIGVPDDMVVSCTVPPVPEVILVTDNCTEEIVPELEETIEGSDCNFKITRTFTAVDSMGNQVIESYCIYSGSYADADNDGFDVLVDCDDEDPTIFPGANELCDTLDNDCDSMIDENCSDCIAENFSNPPTGLFEDQTVQGGTQTLLNWSHYSDAGDGCILRGALSDGVTNIGPFGQVLVQGAGIAGNDEGLDFLGPLGPDATYTNFNPNTFPTGNTGNLIPGATYIWQVRCGCIIDRTLPYPERLDPFNTHLSPWSETDIFVNLGTPNPIAPEVTDEMSNVPLSSGISLYPNPSDGDIWFDATNIEDKVLIEIFELRGKRIFSVEYEHLPSMINLPDFSSGIHLVEFTFPDRKVREKIMLK